MRIELSEDVVPDETTILRFRHLLEKQGLTAKIFELVKELLQAIGRAENFTKKPPPAMWLYGRLSLNRNGAPGASCVNGGLPLGCQKFTSSGASRLRKSNQPLSVTPTQYCIANQRRRRRQPARRLRAGLPGRGRALVIRRGFAFAAPFAARSARRERTRNLPAGDIEPCDVYRTLAPIYLGRIGGLEEELDRLAKVLARFFDRVALPGNVELRAEEQVAFALALDDRGDLLVPHDRLTPARRG